MKPPKRFAYRLHCYWLNPIRHKLLQLDLSLQVHKYEPYYPGAKADETYWYASRELTVRVTFLVFSIYLELAFLSNPTPYRLQ